jgi:hypothetical protein
LCIFSSFPNAQDLIAEGRGLRGLEESGVRVMFGRKSTFAPFQKGDNVLLENPGANLLVQVGDQESPADGDLIQDALVEL